MKHPRKVTTAVKGGILKTGEHARARRLALLGIPRAGLNTRQQEVAALRLRGFSNGAIAHLLGISGRAVHNAARTASRNLEDLARREANQVVDCHRNKFEGRDRSPILDEWDE